MSKNAEKPKVLGIIPARGDSKGIPHKNIVPLMGKPLIYYTINAAKESKLLDAFIVSTDDEEIAEVARALGADVPFLRPAHLAQDDSLDIDFLKHALVWVKENYGWTPDIVVNLRPTTPLRTGEDIDQVIKLLRETGCDSVRTMIKPKHKPHKMCYVSDDMKIQPLILTEHYDKVGLDVPRQLLPQNIYTPSGMVDATRSRFILEEGKVYGPDVRVVIGDPERSIDIDDTDDLIWLEFLMKRRQADK